MKIQDKLAAARRQYKEAVEQQAATAEILHALRRSSADPQPVFEAIIEHAHRLCGAIFSVVLRYDGERLHVVAERLVNAAGRRALRAMYPAKPRRDHSIGRAVLEGRPTHSADLPNDARFPANRNAFLKAFPYRAGVTVPLLRTGKVIGAIATARAEARAYSRKEIGLLRTFAAQAVIAIENVRLFNETNESLERQTATAEILKVIAASPTDVQPVFDAIARESIRLCSASYSVVGRYDGELVHLAAYEHVRAEGVQAIKECFPMRPSRTTTTGRAILERAVVHVPDVLEDADYDKSIAHSIRNRSTLAVPMLLGGEPIGTISVGRLEPRQFSNTQIALLQTFADQAVIAIENARLFNETKEALERQTATGDILASISGSMTDTKPVFDAILRNLLRLFGTRFAVVQMLRDGIIEIPAVDGEPGFERLIENYPRPVDETTMGGRAMLSKEIVRYAPVIGNPEAPSATQQFARDFGFNSVIAAPMIREGTVVGAIVTAHREAHAFEDKQIALIKAFADQAVIAIENVRLFNETKESLERQTATAEILKVIASSPSDVQPVFEAIAVSAMRLLGGRSAAVTRVIGSALHLAALTSINEGADNVLRRLFPMPLDKPGGPALFAGVARSGKPAFVSDYESDPGILPEVREMARTRGFRSAVAVPMIYDGASVGTINVTRSEPGLFTTHQIGLLQTFADQAVIAIENVRLFNETKEALERQTATAEILKVIASSPSDVQPVFDAIAASAMRLVNGYSAIVSQVEGDEIRLAAFTSTDDAGDRVLRSIFPQSVSRGTGNLPRAIRQMSPSWIADTESEPGLAPELLAMSRARGYRSQLAVPMIRNAEVIGGINVTRREPGTFSDHHIGLLRTFADQAVIAIENVRLFRELQDRNKSLTDALEQQTATGDILKAISSSHSELQPVFDTIIKNAVHLGNADVGLLINYDGHMLELAAHHNFDPNAEAIYRSGFPRLASRDTFTGRAVLDRVVVNLSDIESSDFGEGSKGRARRAGYHSTLVVPMLRGGDSIGAIAVVRRQAGAFGEAYVNLLQTFADQAVIAIENVRLFKELEARNKDLSESLNQQTATAEVLKLISRTTFELEKVLQTLLDNATRLSGAVRAAMLRPDAEGNYRPAVTFNYDLNGPLMKRLRERPIRPGRDSITGRALLEKRPIHVPDVLADPEYGRQDLTDIERFRTVLAVPMLRDGEAIGLISLIKGEEVDPFTDKQMEVVTTFADQAVIAIENVRLFKEIEEKSAQLEVANRHKSEFLANMSHELRTPLNAIIGFSEVLMDKMFGEVNEKQADYLKDIHESGKHLLSLINDILDLSKIEAGRMELELGSFHLPTAISNAMTLVRERAQRHGIALGAEIDPRLGEFQADERKVKQILLNLLSNAVKFTPEGGRVDVSAKMDTDKVAIAVRDTGIGIAAEDQAALFEEFKQVGKDSTRKAEGTGLGLALTKRFVELHGGEISVDSAPGKGSTFTVTLPVRQ